MKITRTVLAPLAATLLGLASAHAESFSFSFGNASSLYAGSGTLTGSPNDLGNYLITEISGTTRTTPGGSDLPISSLIPVGSGIYHDNVVGVTGGYSFDSAGLSYELTDGTQLVLFGDSSEYLQAPGGSIVSEAAPITITPIATAPPLPVATTPEPGSIVLLGTGLLGLAGVARQRSRTLSRSVRP